MVLKIGKIRLTNDIILAPMAGFSDMGFRALCYKYGAAFCPTEMVSMKGLKYNGSRTASMLLRADVERPSAVQIFGNSAEIMAEMCLSPAVRAFDIVDINMGCPVPKVFNNGEGCALMAEPKRAEKIIKAVRKNVRTLTVKFRSGIDAGNINAVEFAKMCEGAGADAVTVHARTRKQGYAGAADRRVIADVVRAVRIPVIGNGDIGLTGAAARNAAEAAREAARVREEVDGMKRETNCAAVAIGRGALGRPYIFGADVTDAANEKIERESNETAFMLELIREHIGILSAHYPERFVIPHMRGHLHHYLKYVPDARLLRLRCNFAKSAEEIYEIFSRK